jgi:hypothetical protein
VAVTSIANVALLPVFLSAYYTSYAAVSALVPAMAVFNVAQGTLSILGGYLLYEALKLRLIKQQPQIRSG